MTSSIIYRNDCFLFRAFPYQSLKGERRLFVQFADGTCVVFDKSINDHWYTDSHSMSADFEDDILNEINKSLSLLDVHPVKSLEEIYKIYYEGLNYEYENFNEEKGVFTKTRPELEEQMTCELAETSYN